MAMPVGRACQILDPGDVARGGGEIRDDDQAVARGKIVECRLGDPRDRVRGDTRDMRRPAARNIVQRKGAIGPCRVGIVVAEQDEIVRRGLQGIILPDQAGGGIHRLAQGIEIARRPVNDIILEPDVQDAVLAFIGIGDGMRDIAAVGKEAPGQRVGIFGHDIGIGGAQRIAGDDHVVGGQAVAQRIVADRGEQLLHIGRDLAAVELRIVEQIDRRIGAGEGHRQASDMTAGVALLIDFGLRPREGPPGQRTFDDVIAIAVDRVRPHPERRRADVGPAGGQCHMDRIGGGPWGKDVAERVGQLRDRQAEDSIELAEGRELQRCVGQFRGFRNGISTIIEHTHDVFSPKNLSILKKPIMVDWFW